MSKTARIKLSPLVEADLPLLFEWINDREQVLLNSPYKPVSESLHRRWFEEVQGRSDLFIFGIRIAEGDKLIGTCQLLNVNRIHRQAELQIRIGDVESRGRGYGTEAVQRLVDFGFRDLNLHRISLHVFSDNTTAQRVYEKAGFLREAVLREAAFIDGKYVDVIGMAIVSA